MKEKKKSSGILSEIKKLHKKDEEAVPVPVYNPITQKYEDNQMGIMMNKKHLGRPGLNSLEERKRKNEIQEEINLHKIHMHILQDLKGQHVSRGFQKIYGESGSTGEGFHQFIFATNHKEGYRQWVIYVDPEYLKYLDKNGFEYISILKGRDVIHIDKDGTVLISKADDLIKNILKK